MWVNKAEWLVEMGMDMPEWVEVMKERGLDHVAMDVAGLIDWFII